MFIYFKNLVRCLPYFHNVIISFYKYTLQVFLKLFLHDYIFLKELVRGGTLTLYTYIIVLHIYDYKYFKQTNYINMYV